MKRRLDQSHILEMDALRLDMLEDHRRDLAELRHAFGNFARFALANLQEQRFLAFSPFTSKDSSPPPTESALPNDSAISSSDAQISSSGGSSDSITRTLMPSPSVRFLPTTISLANAGHAVVVKRDTEGPDAATTAAMREVDVGQEVQAGISDVRGGDGGDEEGIAEVREGPKKTVKSKNGLKWLKGFTKVVWKERRGRRSSRLLESDE